MKPYYWIQVNRSKYFAILGALATLGLYIIKAEFWKGFFQGVLAVVIIYFIVFVFQRIKRIKFKN